MPVTWAEGAIGVVVVHWRESPGGWTIDGIDLPPHRRLPESQPHPRAQHLLRRLLDPQRRRATDAVLQAAEAALPSGFAGAVCAQLATAVPPGRVISYGRLAAWTGSPGAARAVGTAMRRNRLPLLVPCHRVIAADGRVGGFQGGRSGAQRRKRVLLEEEGVAFRADGRVAAAAML